jgi:hypothetical protein
MILTLLKLDKSWLIIILVIFIIILILFRLVLPGPV